MTNATTCILLVDDDASLLRLLSIRLESQGYRVETAQDGPGALVAIARFSPALVITDLRMDGMDGAALLDEIQIRWPGLAVLLMTAHGTIPDAVEATQRGAFGFLTKPLDKHELRSHIERAIAVSSGSRSNDAWRRDIVGNSVKLNRLLAQAKQIAITAASVLITGPSGSGKEVLARAIHQASGLDGPFVAINTGALPLELLESELFGHERGSFTGASTQRTGLITAADGGSLFLDEIGDMPAALQVKLLRVLQEGEVRPVGSNRNIAVKVRVISATHRYLPQQIERGEFREDLFYRLGVVELAIPPLAARAADIPLLAHHFLMRLAKTSESRKSLAPRAIELMLRASSPGNIRQLANVVERAHALSVGPVIGARLIADALGESVEQVVSYKDAKHEFTRQYLCQLLTISQGNVSAAARIARRDRSDFYKLLARHSIDPQGFKLNI